MDLIITDYCMPGMTGYELLKKIKVFVLSFFQYFKAETVVLVCIFFIFPEKTSEKRKEKIKMSTLEISGSCDSVLLRLFKFVAVNRNPPLSVKLRW